MSLLALALVLLSALLHATWNLQAKRVSRGAALVWLFAVASTVILTPPVLYLFLRSRPELGPGDYAIILASGGLHLGYMISLQRGYRAGDLSVVYPLARGTGPVLAVAAAVLLLGERPSGLALAGALLVVLGAFVIAGGERVFRAAGRQALAYGLLTGLFIASYTLTDAYAVSTLAVPPLVLMWGTELVRTIVLAPVALRRSEEVRHIWRVHRPEVLIVAILSPAAYLLVLVALGFTPVSYVAPVRELSILFGAALGAGFLNEGEGWRRLFAAGLMALGVAALSLG